MAEGDFSIDDSVCELFDEHLPQDPHFSLQQVVDFETP